VIDEANANLSVILGDPWQRNKIPVWASTLKQFVALKTKVANRTFAERAGTEIS
jgi:hypothetical protein